jgi:predicted transcriptional regulator
MAHMIHPIYPDLFLNLVKKGAETKLILQEGFSRSYGRNSARRSRSGSPTRMPTVYH